MQLSPNPDQKSPKTAPQKRSFQEWMERCTKVCADRNRQSGSDRANDTVVFINHAFFKNIAEWMKHPDTVKIRQSKFVRGQLSKDKQMRNVIMQFPEAQKYAWQCCIRKRHC